MREIILRLINHTFLLFFWLFLSGALMVGAIYLVFSNWINFSDSWNQVHPSVPILNDAFLNVIVSIVRKLETDLNLSSHHLSRLLSRFDYGHGYAIAQTIGTLIVETIMAWSGWMFWRTRHRQMDFEDIANLQQLIPAQVTAARLNIRQELRRYFTAFSVFLSLTILIWIFDFYLTFAKQTLISQDHGMFNIIGPLGTILLMTTISVSFAWLIEAIREEITQIIGDVFQFIEHIIGPPSSVIQQLPPELSAGRPELPEEGQSQSQQTPPSQRLLEETVAVYGINGVSHIPLREIQERWQSGEIIVDERGYSQGQQLSASEMFQVVNPTGDNNQEWYYTSEGINNFDSNRYEWGENRTIILHNA